MKSAKVYVCKEQYVSKDWEVKILVLASQTLCIQCVAVGFGEGNFQG